MSIFDKDLITNEKTLPPKELVEFYAKNKIDELIVEFGKNHQLLLNSLLNELIKRSSISTFSYTDVEICNHLNDFIYVHTEDITQYIEQHTDIPTYPSMIVDADYRNISESSYVDFFLVEVPIRFRITYTNTGKDSFSYNESVWFYYRAKIKFKSLIK